MKTKLFITNIKQYKINGEGEKIEKEKNKQMTGNKFSQCLWFITVLSAVIIIVSNIIGFFWLNSAVILIVSAIIAFVLTKKFPLKIETNKSTLILLGILVLLLAYPVLTITPFFPASTDAVSTTMLRILDGKIPLTHEPYSGITLSYPLGFSLIANTFSEIITLIPDYLWIWIIGIIAGILQLFFFSLFASELFKDKKVLLLAAAVFLTSKLIFENFYVGEFAWYIGTSFAFAFLYAHIKKHPFQYLFFPAAFACHPVAGFNLLIIFGTYILFYKPKINELAKLGLSLVLVLPLLVMSYGPIAFNLLLNGNKSSIFLPQKFVSGFMAMPFWIGTGLTILLAVTLILSILKKKNLFAEIEQKFIWSLLLISIIIFALLGLIGFILVGKEIEVVIIAAALLTINLIKYFQLKQKYKAIIIAGILIIALIFFFNSSILEHYRGGSKISPDGREFAKQFYAFDGGQKTVLFLTKNGGGKIAEYSNKIPYDANTQHTISISEFLYYEDEGYKEMQNKKEIQLSIFNGEIDKIQNLAVDYIVINTDEFKQNIPYQKIFEYKQFKLFKK